MTFKEWPSIQQLHNVVKDIEATLKMKNEGSTDISPQNLCFDKEVKYKSKVKLHGQNAAISIQRAGNDIDIRPQSRSQFTDDGSFAGKILKDHKKYFIENYFLKNEDYFKKLLGKDVEIVNIYGEVCGSKIQKGVALSNLKEDIFAIFSIVINDSLIIYSPELLNKLLPNLPKRFYVLPWHKDEKGNEFIYTLNYMNTNQMQKEADKIDEEVIKIDKVDPWVLENFKIKGHGEGLVLYPINIGDKELCDQGIVTRKIYEVFTFKAKGDKHRNVKTKKSAQVDTEVVKNAKAYADLMVTSQRCEQACGEVGVDIKKMKNFLKWVEDDVKKEGKDELKASNLTWDQVKQVVSKTAGDWYRKKCFGVKK